MNQSLKSLINRFLLVTLAIGGFFIVGTNQAAAQEQPGTFIPSACMFESIDLGLTEFTGESLGFECGYVFVPERHANPTGPTIRIPVAFRKASGSNIMSDPLILAQGGPGGDAFEIFTLLVPNTPIAGNRDIIIFNQRGTLYAEPFLTCSETTAILPETLKATPDEAAHLYENALMACYERLQNEGVDLSAYNSLENAADIPMIASALGYDEYNFYGVSYGTMLGLHLMRNHPEGLRSVILDSVVPTDVDFIAEVPLSEDRALNEIFSACEADAPCRLQYPNLKERYFAIIRKLDNEPVTTSLTNPDTGETYETYIDGKGLRSIIFQLLYVPNMSAVLPKVIHDLEKGDLRYIQAMMPLFVFEEAVAEGMYYSVMCAEDADIDLEAISLEGLPAEIATTAPDDLQNFIETCEMWQVEKLPPSIDDPVSSDIPTLLLSGRFDPITPPAFAATAAATLGNAVNLVDTTASHGVAFFNPCVVNIIDSFLNDPTQTPDSSCLNRQELPEAVPPNAITLPILSGINSLSPATLTSLGIGAILLLIILSPFFIWPIVWFFRALTNKPASVSAENKRLRRTSRILMLVYGLLAMLFAIGLLGFIVLALSRPVYATALALPATAAPVLWVPLFLLLLAVLLLAAVFMLWPQRGTGSIAGKLYFTLVAIAAIAFVFFLGTQNLLIPQL